MSCPTAFFEGKPQHILVFVFQEVTHKTLSFQEKEGRAVIVGVLVSRVILVTLVTMGTKEPRDSEVGILTRRVKVLSLWRQIQFPLHSNLFLTPSQDLPEERVSQESQCLCHHETLCDHLGTWATLVPTEVLVAWETLAPLACQDDQVRTETLRFKMCLN